MKGKVYCKDCLFLCKEGKYSYDKIEYYPEHVEYYPEHVGTGRIIGRIVDTSLLCSHGDSIAYSWKDTPIRNEEYVVVTVKNPYIKNKNNDCKDYTRKPWKFWINWRKA